VNGTTFFNVAFGHWNEGTGELDDKVVSNNNDATKILATVAATVIEFLTHFSDMPVIARGSTPARTRLYQISISANLAEIEAVLLVYGWIDDRWERFQKNRNYDAFFVRLKSN
jgi:hypothetical protein